MHVLFFIVLFHFDWVAVNWPFFSMSLIVQIIWMTNFYYFDLAVLSSCASCIFFYRSSHTKKQSMQQNSQHLGCRRELSNVSSVSFQWENVLSFLFHLYRTLFQPKRKSSEIQYMGKEQPGLIDFNTTRPLC